MIGYFKAEPTEFARITSGGRVGREGRGISGLYTKYNTSIELVDLGTVDQPAMFNETTSDKQPVSLQGGFLYSIKDAGQVFANYNFSINPKTRKYQSEDVNKLPEHVLNLVRGKARGIIQDTKLEDVLVMSDTLSTTVLEELSKNELLGQMGIGLKSVYFNSISPTPEIRQALGAEYRAELLTRADEKEYGRRAKAVENERKIQDNEQRNSIELEEGRKKLVALQGENAMSEAQFAADAAKLGLDVYQGLNADFLRAHALLELGKRAGSIGNLTITTELLAGLGGVSR